MVWDNRAVKPYKSLGYLFKAFPVYPAPLKVLLFD
jgi:hypothetical protein